MGGMQPQSGNRCSTLKTCLCWLIIPCAAFWLRPRLSLLNIGICAALLGYLRKAKVIGPDAQMQDMDGKNGGNTGLGYETALTLASWGADVTIACRNMKKANAAVKRMQERLAGMKYSSSGSICAMELDLTDLDSIALFSVEYAKKVKDGPLDVLINNAGVMAIKTLERTNAGFEMTMGTNHLGHFALTQRSSDGRIVNVSSLLHKSAKPSELLDNFNYASRPEEYGKWDAYGKSKLANVLFTHELQKRLDKKRIKITATALEPGIVRTELGRHVFAGCYLKAIITFFMAILISPMSKSPSQGAQTQIRCASDPYLRGENAAGKYFRNCKLKPNTTGPQNDDIALELWKLSEQLTKRKFL